MSTLDHDTLVAWTRFTLADSRRMVAESQRLREAQRALFNLRPLGPVINLPSYKGDAALQAEVDRVLKRTMDPSKKSDGP